MAKSKKTNSSKSYKNDLLMNFYDVKLSESQQALYDKIQNNKIIIVQGPAGSAKTFTACYAALKALEASSVQKIYITKPIEESGEKLGALPGDVHDKTAAYLESFTSNMSKIINSKDLGGLMQSQHVEFKPLAYMRGSGYDNCIMMLDEAQNADFRQLMLYVTRMGKNAKVILLGDISQYDIKKDVVALTGFANMVEGIEDIAFHEFTNEDIVRNKILVEITKRYEKLKADGGVTRSK
jgi:phosphate starvation-inducible protein PhoH and related proteins